MPQTFNGPRYSARGASSVNTTTYASGVDGTNWLYAGFDDSGWIAGTNGVGYGASNAFIADYAAAIAPTLPIVHYRLNEASGTAAVNIGSGQEVSIASLAGLIAHKTGLRGRIHFDPSKPDGQPRRCLDVGRAREALGFEAATSLSDGLEQTITWYLAQRQDYLAKAG